MQRSSARDWANNLMAKAKLGDKRRNRRASALIVSMLNSADGTVRCNEALRERYYRHARADNVAPDLLLQAGCEAIAADIITDTGSEDILLIGDTTSLSYRHSVAAELGVTGTSTHAKSRG